MSEVGAEAILSQRKEYYTKSISEYLSKYPDNFRDFVGNEEIIRFGDRLLSERLTAGYNFATFEQFPINSKESLIFYGVYSQRTEHFGELLARMEQEGIIREENVSFGIRATKVFGRWEDPESNPGKISMLDGSGENTRESVEGIVIFSPDSPDQAKDIATFLVGKAPKIEGGYEIPDTRATPTDDLKKALVAEGAFKIAKANVYKFDRGNIIALRQKGVIKDRNWKKINSLVNPELYEFLTAYGVEP